jgi:hypothetical protein
MIGTDHEIRIKAVKDIPAAEWEIVEMWVDRAQATPDLPPVNREDFIAHTSGLTHLRGFYVRQVELRDADLAFLANNPDLAWLRLVSVPVTDGVLVHISALKKLRVFDVGGARAFTGQGMEKLAGLPVLDDLVVCQTAFTDSAVRVLAACPKLRVAQISETAISDESLRTLKTHPSLQEIYLDRAAITDAGLTELAAVKTLKKLSLVGVPVSDAAVTALQKALPECRVVRSIP